MTQPTPYPPGGPVYSEQIATAPAGPVQVDPAIVAAVAAQLAQQQPPPPPPVQVVPRPPQRREVPVEDGVADFDALWAEHRAKAPKIKVFGKVYELSPTMPAQVIVFYERHHATPEHKFGPDQILEMLGALIGEENLRELMAKGLGMEEFQDLLRYCMRAYRIGEDEGEAEAGAATGASSA